MTWAESRPTEVERSAAAKAAMEMLADITLSLSGVRIAAVRNLWTTGWSLSDISEALSISRARVHQIIEK